MRTIEGVTPEVAAAMNAVDANVLCEDGLLQRTCEHGIRHPVGHLHGYKDGNLALQDPSLKKRHDKKTRWGMAWGGVQCDGCCSGWKVDL